MENKKICMNAACGAMTSVEWKKGWDLRSGGFATLCFNCGYAFENLAFCDTFHLEETGWRECSLCKKRLHCGCIASKAVLELLEFGGVGCSSCARSYQPNPIWRCQVPNHIDTSTLYNDGNARSTPAAKAVDADTSVNTEKFLHLGSDIASKEMLLHLGSDTVSKEKLLRLGSDTVCKEQILHLGSDTVSKDKILHLGNFMETIESSHFPKFPQPPKVDKNSSNDMIKKEDFMSPIRELGGFLSLIQPSVESSKNSISNNNIPLLGDKDMYETLPQPSMSIALTSPSEAPNFKPIFLSGVVNEREQNKARSSFQQGQKSRPILPKPSKLPPSVSFDATKATSSQVRVARPPGEGRGGNQLLPRYWPRITDEELRKLSGELKSNVVPLFEKVLSASDAGRIGRLVLPKACAEAYFPAIIQSEGLPIRIQDAKGNEWIFQFRFWPNNNSRMYVLEGVTPCIQSMQLEAGDTVTFSRIDPGGKLVIGSRKATGIVDMQDGETSALPNGIIPGEMPISVVPTINGFTGLFQSPKEFKDLHHSTPGDHLNVVDENISWPKSEKPRNIIGSKSKKTRNIIGSKSKRLLMDSDDVMELRFTWEESQDLLRPPPSVKPNIVSIEDHEIEEYDEPPVFGKKTIFTMQPSGEQEQWAQCDNCFKWRKLPLDFLLPSKWTCSDNVWDPNRCSCSAPDDMSPKEVENLFKTTKDFKRRRTTESHNVVQEDHMSCGLDALASAAILGEESVSDEGDGLTGVTTKHPRHRPGCSCIVCIQPPSGKGKHKSTCTCNVCQTVKRRFQTQMLRRKIRQSEREAEVAQKDGMEMNEDQPGNGQIDLNFQPDHLVDMQHKATNGMIMMNLVQVAGYNEDDQHEASNGVSMMNPDQVTGFPLETCLKQNKLTDLASLSQQGIEESEKNMPDASENGLKPAACKHDNEAG